jgi:hypothetical protein
VTGLRLSAHGPTARAEFRRTLLRSLIGTAEAEVELRRSRRQRVRARRAERRLDQLRRQLSALDDGPRTERSRWARSPALGRAVSVLWLAGAVLLGAEIAVDGVHSTTVIVGDVVMLVLSLAWFLLAVARVPVSEPRSAGTAPRE